MSSSAAATALDAFHCDNIVAATANTPLAAPPLPWVQAPAVASLFQQISPHQKRLCEFFFGHMPSKEEFLQVIEAMLRWMTILHAGIYTDADGYNLLIQCANYSESLRVLAIRGALAATRPWLNAMEDCRRRVFAPCPTLSLSSPLHNKMVHSLSLSSLFSDSPDYDMASSELLATQLRNKVIASQKDQHAELVRAQRDYSQYYFDMFNRPSEQLQFVLDGRSGPETSLLLAQLALSRQTTSTRLFTTSTSATEDIFLRTTCSLTGRPLTRASTVIHILRSAQTTGVILTHADARINVHQKRCPPSPILLCSASTMNDNTGRGEGDDVAATAATTTTTTAAATPMTVIDSIESSPLLEVPNQALPYSQPRPQQPWSTTKKRPRPASGDNQASGAPSAKRRKKTAEAKAAAPPLPLFSSSSSSSSTPITTLVTAIHTPTSDATATTSTTSTSTTALASEPLIPQLDAYELSPQFIVPTCLIVPAIQFHNAAAYKMVIPDTILVAWADLWRVDQVPKLLDLVFTDTNATWMAMAQFFIALCFKRSPNRQPLPLHTIGLMGNAQKRDILLRGIDARINSLTGKERANLLNEQVNKWAHKKYMLLLQEQTQAQVNKRIQKAASRILQCRGLSILLRLAFST